MSPGEMWAQGGGFLRSLLETEEGTVYFFPLRGVGPSMRDRLCMHQLGDTAFG